MTSFESSSASPAGGDVMGEGPHPAPHDEALQAVEGRMDGDGQFQVVEGAAVRCLTCERRFAAESQNADRVERLEGASDPADQSMLVPMRCPHCGVRGTLVVRYGPEASADEAELLVTLDRSPGETGRD